MLSMPDLSCGAEELIAYSTQP